MKKLNSVEIDVLVNEIIENVENLKLSKVKELLKENSDYLEIVENLKKIKELKKVEDDLKSKVNDLNKNLSKEFKVNVNFSNSWDEESKIRVSLDYKEKEKFNYYEVKKRIVLNNISNEINVEDFIKKFVDELV